mmetsp:Transcript_4496/g.9010  ORF Transcript_4496/g.9010 Transcript_4496/m.9010 type:complete len:293 (-) Transcript_4496:195-1073(-)|eukprot:CAMPEP_0170180780 /NCGR_PEP_ID=MMETSP0040_2-20121228/23002_1 /TAXON_ID=641309 /ORGANISM="Lotharella oceanica, Strain CCMP622" /LENGTH=292 /DNA_ID=CAMNT_0010425539 /DNA_START=51 /DNA_END=932 /DNA_ORIENTATION=-
MSLLNDDGSRELDMDLYWNCGRMKQAKVANILQKNPKLVNDCKETGYGTGSFTSPFITAIHGSQGGSSGETSLKVPFVRYLVEEAKADVNGTPGKAVPLVVAAREYDHKKWEGGEVLGMVKLLVENGAAVNATDMKGRTALLAAAGKPYHDKSVISYLLEKKANLYHRDNDGKSFMEVVCESQKHLREGSRETIKYFAELYDDPEVWKPYAAALDRDVPTLAPLFPEIKSAFGKVQNFEYWYKQMTALQEAQMKAEMDRVSAMLKKGPRRGCRCKNPYRCTGRCGARLAFRS